MREVNIHAQTWDARQAALKQLGEAFQQGDRCDEVFLPCLAKKRADTAAGRHGYCAG